MDVSHRKFLLVMNLLAVINLRMMNLLMFTLKKRIHVIDYPVGSYLTLLLNEIRLVMGPQQICVFTPQARCKQMLLQEAKTLCPCVQFFP